MTPSGPHLPASSESTPDVERSSDRRFFSATTIRWIVARRVRPLLRTLWNIVAGGLRVVVWESLKTGLIDLRPLNRTLRLLTLAGLLLIFGFVASLLFSDVLRTQGTLEPLTFESSATRGLLVPSAAIPLTLAALVLAWSYVLAGALHVRRGVRWLIFLIYFLFGFTGLALAALSTAGQSAGLDIGIIGGILLGALVLLVAAFIRLPHHPWPNALEFCLMLGLNAVPVTAVLAQAALAQQSSGFPYTPNLVTILVGQAQVLIVPFLIFAGMEMVGFGLDVTKWVAQSVQRYAAAWITTLLLVVVLGYRLWVLFSDYLAEGVAGDQWQAWAGAALLCAGLALAGLWRRRQTGEGDVPDGLIMALIVGVALFQILLAPPLTLITLFFQLYTLLPEAVGQVDLTALLDQANRAIGVVGELSDQYYQYMHLFAAGVGLLVAGIAARRRRATIAAFGLILAWNQGVEWLTEPGRPLAALHYEYADVDAILLLALAALTLFWIARRLLDLNPRSSSRQGSGKDAPLLVGEGTGSRSDKAGVRSVGEAWPLRLLALAVLGSVLTQTDFLDNPFSPLFGFAGVFFLAFGILWSALTAGGSYTNTSTPGWPRASRLLLYIGYALLSASIAHWFTVSHNVELKMLQSDLTMSGFRAFGLSLAYLAFAEGGGSLVADDQERKDRPPADPE